MTALYENPQNTRLFLRLHTEVPSNDSGFSVSKKAVAFLSQCCYELSKFGSTIRRFFYCASWSSHLSSSVKTNALESANRCQSGYIYYRVHSGLMRKISSASNSQPMIIPVFEDRCVSENAGYSGFSITWEIVLQ